VTLSDLLRQLHLVVETVVSAENQANDTYANELYACVLDEHLPRIRDAVEARRRT
jgi:hypothetical protein